VPDAVVVNLGTNDSGHKDMKPEAYTQAWRDFIKTLRGHYPQAHIFCTVAPMGSHPALEACIKTAVEEANAAGDAKVHAIHLPEQDEKLDGIGADWHPTVKCHERLAGVLAPLIGKALGW
jgi:lysophospholipase L1-like esterase